MNIPFLKPKTYFLKKESELLIGLLSDKISEEHVMTIERTLQEPLDWNYLINTALTHRITPIVYFNMKKNGLFEMVPDFVQTDMRKIYLESLARNLAYYEELKIILEKFKNANMNSLVLKGAILAQSIYEDNGLRMFSDIDILINRKDMETFHQTMEGMGYMVSEKSRPLDYYDTCHFHYIYLKESNFITHVMELHWDLFPPSHPIHLDLKSLWNNRIFIPSGETEISTLNWDDHFLFLCARCASDGFKSLLNVCDLIRMTRKLNDASWNDVKHKAKMWGIEKAVVCCAEILKNMFGESIPHPELSLKRSQKFFIHSMCSPKNILQHNWTFGPLAILFLFEQSKKEFVRINLFPRDKELFRHYYHIPKKIKSFKRFIFFLKGIKSLAHIGWSFIKICFLQIWH
jgi:hypothetical protein